MTKWLEQQHMEQENIITLGVQEVLKANEAKWDGIVKRARWWNLTFTILLTAILAVMTVVARSFLMMAEQQKSDSIELHNYLSEKKIQDAKESSEWSKNMNKWNEKYGNDKLIRKRK
jgi:uncharacterized protein YpmS